MEQSQQHQRIKAVLIDFPPKNRTIALTFDVNTGWISSDPTDTRITIFDKPVDIAYQV